MTPSSSTQSRLQASSPRPVLRSLGVGGRRGHTALLFFFLLEALAVLFYINAEHTFYFWDHGMYHTMAAAFAAPDAARWEMFRQSLTQEYPLFFALPSLLTFPLFGTSREVFILTNFFAFFVPFQLASGLLLKRVMSDGSSRLPSFFSLPLAGRDKGRGESRQSSPSFFKRYLLQSPPLPNPPREGEGEKKPNHSQNTQPTAFYHPFLFAALASALIPSLWVPLLEGYPDHGAAALITFALAIGLNPKRGWKTALALGLTLAFAILLRRHFAYPALAVMIGLAVADLFKTTPSPKRHPVEKRDPAVRDTSARGSHLWIPTFVGMTKETIFFWILTGTAFLAALFFIAPVFLHNALTIDYTALYASYKKPVGAFFWFFAGGYGALLLLTAIAAFFLCPRTRLIAAITFLELILWCLGPAQAGHHYLLHLMPAFLVVAMGGLAISLKKQKALPLFLAALLIFNALYALAFAKEATPPNDHGTPSFFSAPRPPVVRDDYAQLVALAKSLAQETKPQDRILALGSSFIFNQDLVVSVFKQTGLDLAPLYRLLTASEIDIKQGPPLDAFASATLYLVPTPAQYHLAPSGQKVVTAAAAPFPPQGANAALFHKIGAPFSLDQNVSVQLWRRDPWTPDALDETLSLMKKIAPWNQEWVLMQTPVIGQTGDDIIQTFFTREQNRAELFLHRRLEKGSFRFETKLQTSETCLPRSAFLTLKRANGETLWQKPLAAALVPGTYAAPFDAEKDSFLTLTLIADSEPQSVCSVILSGISVTP